jgi:hypothetical protein
MNDDGFSILMAGGILGMAFGVVAGILILNTTLNEAIKTKMLERGEKRYSVVEVAHKGWVEGKD